MAFKEISDEQFLERFGEEEAQKFATSQTPQDIQQGGDFGAPQQQVPTSFADLGEQADPTPQMQQELQQQPLQPLGGDFNQQFDAAIQQQGFQPLDPANLQEQPQQAQQQPQTPQLSERDQLQADIQQTIDLNRDQPEEGLTGAAQKVGEFIGIDKFAKGLGMALFRFTPEFKDLKGMLDRGEITPEQFTSIATGDLTAGEIAGSAALTAANVATGGGASLARQAVAKGGSKLAAAAGIGGLGAATGAASELESGETDLAEIGKGAAVGVGVAGAFPAAGKLVKGAVDTVKKTTKFGTAQVTGLSQDTIDTIIKNPEKFNKEAVESFSRDSLAAKVKNTVDSRLSDLASTGKEYETIRKSLDKVELPKEGLSNILKNKGINVVDGKIQVTADSLPMTASDKGALQEFVDVFGDLKELNANQFLNARTSLSNLAKFEQGKSNASTALAKELRKFYDVQGKSQIQGLADLDAKFAPEVRLMGEIKNDLINRKTGDLKDNAVSVIANLTGKGKENKLKRLEKIAPGIEGDVKILKAIEDLTIAGDQKVGTYSRALLLGGGAATGNVPAIAAAVLANPKIAVNILRAYGKANTKFRGDANKIAEKMERGEKLNKQEGVLLRDAIKDMRNFGTTRLLTGEEE